MALRFGKHNLTANTSWQPEPQTRGTWSLVSTCLITLSLCIWTALHLNLPEATYYQQPWWRRKQTGRKIGWLLVGLFAPEILVCAAAIQWQEAREAMKIYNEHFGFPEPQKRRWFGPWRHSNKSSSTTQVSDDTSEMDLLNNSVSYCIQPLNTPKTLGFYFLLKHTRKPASRKRQSAVTAKAITRNHTSQSNGDGTGRRSPWTLRQGFMVAMGGLVVEPSTETPPILPGDHQNLILQPDGLALILEFEPQAIPSMPTTVIDDKSKMDGLGKFVVCIQAVYFSVNGVVRLASRLPLSLLELNTFCHCLCALLVYYIWWDKPLDVSEPIKIQDEHSKQLYALLAHRLDKEPETPWPAGLMTVKEAELQWPHKWWDAEKEQWIAPGRALETSSLEEEAWPGYAIAPTLLSNVEMHIGLEARRLETWQRTIKEESSDSSRSEKVETFRVPRGRVIPETNLIYQYGKTSISDANVADETSISDDAIHVAEWRVRQAQQLWKFWELRGGEDACRSWHSARARTIVQGNHSRASKTDRVGIDFPRSLISKPLESSWWLVLWLGPLVYGALYALAWNSWFPTKPERDLWRVSCVFVMAGVFLSLIYWYIARISMELRAKEKLRAEGDAKSSTASWTSLISWLITISSVNAVFWLLLLTIAARAYLVVESFLSLRDLPLEVYKTTPWSAYFPSIS